MKKLSFLLLFISFISFGQDYKLNPEKSKVYIFENTKIEWNTSDMTIKGEIDNVKLDGKLSTQKIGSTYGNNYYVLESSTGSIAFKCVILPSGGTSSCSEVYISSSNLKDLVKAIKKENFSKISMKYEKFVVYVINKELIIKQQKAIEQLKNNIQTYEGVYKVIIKESLRGTRFKNQYGELYISESGIKLETKIPSMERISGSYELPNPLDSLSYIVWDTYNEAGTEGKFIGKLDNQIKQGILSYEGFSLSFNEDLTSAVLKLTDQTKGGRITSYDKTKINIVDKISDLD